MVENKADLLGEDYNKNINELEEFALKNRFLRAFRTSCKTGLNINESMEFLIDNIVERINNNLSYFNNCEKHLYKYIDM